MKLAVNRGIVAVLAVAFVLSLSGMSAAQVSYARINGEDIGSRCNTFIYNQVVLIDCGTGNRIKSYTTATYLADDSQGSLCAASTPFSCSKKCDYIDTCIGKTACIVSTSDRDCGTNSCLSAADILDKYLIISGITCEPIPSAAASASTVSGTSSENTACSTSDSRQGVCRTTSSCSAEGKQSVPGFCSGPSDIQCCVLPLQAAADTAAPVISIFTFLIASATGELEAGTDEPAVCHISEDGNVYRNPTQFGTAHSWTLTGLTNGQRTYYVKCTDGDGKVGTVSAEVDVNILGYKLCADLSNEISCQYGYFCDGVDVTQQAAGKEFALDLNECNQRCVDHAGSNPSYSCYISQEQSDAFEAASRAEYKLCQNGGRAYCQVNACSAGFTEMDTGGVGFSFEADCIEYCQLYVSGDSASCSYSPTYELCRDSRTKVLTCRNPATGDDCADNGETLVQRYNSAEECQAARNQAAPPITQATCQQACKSNRARDGQCSAVGIRYSPYGYSTPYGSASTSVGTIGSPGQYCAQNQQCNCFYVRNQFSFSFQVTNSRNIVQHNNDFLNRVTIDGVEKLDRQGDITYLRNAPVVNPNSNAIADFVDSVKFGNVQIRRGDEILAEKKSYGTSGFDGVPTPLFLQVGEKARITVKGDIQASSQHCGGFEYTCLNTYIPPSDTFSGCREDRDWKGLRPRSGLKAESCGDDVRIARKNAMKTDWSTLAAIACEVGVVSLAAGEVIASGGAGAGVAAETMYKGSILCFGILGGGEACKGDVQLSARFSESGVGITAGAGSGSVSTTLGGITGSQKEDDRELKEKLREASPYSLAYGGGILGCGISLIASQADNTYNCYSVCGRVTTDVRAKNPVEVCGQNGFPIGADEIVYDGRTGCIEQTISAELNPISKVIVTVNYAGGSRDIEVPVTNGHFDKTITLPDDLGLDSVEPGEYSFTIGKVSK
ncbi:MAG: hypothetical protein HYT73_02420 [Candidatus Aenigmarchaeota archaeon]|nr:hypothetical protein [Candidatus Aenigmarchaeota archaeon]